MKNLTAKLYHQDSEEYRGTAWLFSCEYALTAAHCVGDREQGELYEGPFRLVFENKEEAWAGVVPGNYDFPLDVALLEIISGKVPSDVKVICGKLPTYDPWPMGPDALWWTAYGYPVGKPSGMTITGTIVSPDDNVGSAPAIQLDCHQGGFGHLQGTSGAAVLYQNRSLQKNVIFGLVRWAPTVFEQRVVYAAPFHLIVNALPKMNEIFNANFWQTLSEVAPDLLTPSTINDLPSRRGVDKELIGKNTPYGAGAGRHNLPEQQTAFISRKETEEVVDLLRRGDVRLLTLAGASGTGKTRVASEAGATLVQRRTFRDGVFFVGLATLKDHDKVAREIANTLGIKEAQNLSFAESLKLYLADKQMLLILDNFEHVVEAASLLTGLLDECPGLKILVTSLDPLGLAREKVCDVGPLTPPPRSVQGLTLQRLKAYPAVRLFIARAREVNRKFEFTEQNAMAVAGICSALGGLPMAVEIVAAQTVTQVELQKAIERMEASAAGSLSDKLRTAVEWAYGQLPPEEQSSLRRLSVFVGSFTRAAAEYVCRDAGDTPKAVQEMLDALSVKCLLQEERSPNRETRYRMLQKIQEYCLKEMEVSGEAVAARGSHASFYLEKAKKAEARMTVLTSEERKGWLDLLEKELDDIRAVLKWSLEIKDGGELGLQLASSLFWFWNLRGYLSEGREHVVAALERAGTAATAEGRARALYCAGGLAFLRGDYKDARGWLEESVKLWREIGNKRRLGYSLIILGMVALNEGFPDEGRKYEEESLSIFREVDDRWGLALSLNDLGNVLNEGGNRDQGQLHYQQSLALWREMDDKWGYSLTLSNMGQLALWNGDHITARELQLESLAIRRAEGDQWGFAESLRRLGSVFVAQNDYVPAARLHYDSLLLHQQLGRKQLVAECLEDLAWVAVKLKQPLRAAELYGAGEAIRGDILAELTPSKQNDYNERVEVARAEAGASDSSAEFDQAWLRGADLTTEQAVALATQYLKEWTQSQG